MLRLTYGKFCKLSLIGTLLLLCCHAWASIFVNPTNQKVFLFYKSGFYVGVFFGIGNTTWQNLVGDDLGTLFDTPTKANDVGPMGGVVLGYSIYPNFSFEAAYSHFSNTKIYFYKDGNPYGVNDITSRTDVFYFIGKFEIPLYNYKLYAFASAGPAIIFRSDILAKIRSRTTPTFGVGFVYRFQQQWFAQIAFQYYAGFAKSDSFPVYYYIPFIYTVNAMIAFRLGI